MSLYAGDGVVTKITPSNYVSEHEGLPLVLFPFVHHPVECGRQGQSFYIENYPWLNTNSITKSDVDTMRKNLAELGLKFKPQDDKPDNLARMPDGSLAIIDGDAVELKPGCNKIALKKALEEWVEKVHSSFPDLYAPGVLYGQTEATDYSIRVHKSPALTPQEVMEKPHHRTQWYKRIMEREFAKTFMGLSL